MLINNIRKSPTCPIRNTIHAPTRGATSAVAWKWKLHIISIHAPTRGATPYGLLTANVRLFQSTLLQEERQFLLRLEVPYQYFNPRSYKRSDRMKNHSTNLCRFQSTLLQEERLMNSTYLRWENLFQSTLLQEERQPPSANLGRLPSISIHAPTRGATLVR